MSQLNASEQKTVNFIYNNPGSTVADIAQLLGFAHNGAWYRLSTLVKRGYLHKEPGKSNNGGKREFRYYVRNASTTADGVTPQEQSKPAKGDLSSFTPRELMTELKRRGYTGKLEYTKTIDLSKNF